MLNWPHFTNGVAFEWRRIRRQGIAKLPFKMARHAASALLWLILLPLTIALHLAGFRRVTVFTERIGHLAIEPDCLLKEQALGLIPKRRWFILAPPGRIANTHLLRCWEPFFRIFRGKGACFILASMSRWGLLRHDISRYVLAFNEANAAHKIYAQWGDRPPLIALIGDDERWGAQALQRLGLPDGAWFVCVHVREPGYSSIDEELHSHRNGSVEATIPAMREITRRGGWVVRIGDPTMKHLPPTPQVVDYAHHPAKCDRLDIILCARARFILGNTSGIALVGTIFGVPCAIANMIPISEHWFNAKDMCIHKHLWPERLGRYLGFDEAMALPVANYHYAKLYKDAGIRVDENTPEEIRDLVIKMLDNLDGIVPGN